jgi:transketolase
VREHGMAAAMKGMALHGGIIPYSGTFLVFSDYCRPAIRLAALMGQRVIHVMTHDSIGLGEDGPTHQPIEQLAALRAIPNLKVFRPGDAVETAECWQLALESKSGPSILALTRQNVPQLRLGFEAANRCARGAYELLAAEGGAASVSLFASGSEVAIAVAARKLLAAQGVAARVVSVPCFELLLARRTRCRTRSDHRLCAGQARGRGRHPPRLGRDYRLGWNFCGPERFRRQCALQTALPAFWHYPRKSGGGGAGRTRASVKNRRET